MASAYECGPPRTSGRPRLKDTANLPYQVRRIYEETHKALCSELHILAAIGIRALVEAVCKEETPRGRTWRKRSTTW